MLHCLLTIDSMEIKPQVVDPVSILSQSKQNTQGCQRYATIHRIAQINEAVLDLTKAFDLVDHVSALQSASILDRRGFDSFSLGVLRLWRAIDTASNYRRIAALLTLSQR